MRRRLLPPALLLLAGLAACKTPLNRSVDAVHAPVVTRYDLAYDIVTGGAPLSPSQVTALSDYFASIRLRYGDRVVIQDGSPNGAAQREASIAKVVGQFGLGVAAEHIGISYGVMRVLIHRSRADVNGCPDWRRESNFEFAASTTSNFGCASQSNLAAMIADPNDLITGKDAGGVSDSYTAERGVKVWRQSIPTGIDKIVSPGATGSGGR